MMPLPGAWRACSLAFALLWLPTLALGWKCPRNRTVCEVWLQLEHRLTMMRGKSLIVVNEGSLYPYDTANFSADNEVHIRHVVTGDGWPEPKLVIAVNGSVPGPLLEVWEGQTVRVHVTNRMMSESTSVHFHGQLQRGTPWMDGVAFVTQCPVLPGQSFTHQFQAEPAGTFWYHGHSGGQTAMGVNGGFIVHPRDGAHEDRYDDQFTLLVQDWNHDWDSTVGYLKMAYGMYVGGEKKSASHNLAGVSYSMFRCHSVLINGRGRYWDPDTGHHNGAPIETFTVRKGKTYRFRVINSGSVYPMRVSVDGHKLRVVATDGMDLLTPLYVDAVILTPGERYDFELDANNSVNNYWIRAQTLEVNVDHVGAAILHYEGALEGLDPTTKGRECREDAECTVVNCPFLYYPAKDHTVCINVDKLRGADPLPPELGAEAPRVKDYFLNFAFPGTTETPASVNGVQMVLPRVSALTQPRDVDTRCADDQVCHCTPVLDIAEGEVVQLVMTNLGKGKGWDHPIHLHGHSFHVIKVGHPTYDLLTGKIIADNADIDCRGNPDRDQSFCNNATWADPGWSGNSVPGLELSHPVIKDTVNVPSGGYVVVRIKGDNPGLWAMHCHVSLHMEDGMFLLVNESFPRQPPPPHGFRTCGDFTVPYPSPSPAPYTPGQGGITPTTPRGGTSGGRGVTAGRGGSVLGLVSAVTAVALSVSFIGGLWF